MTVTGFSEENPMVDRLLSAAADLLIEGAGGGYYSYAIINTEVPHEILVELSNKPWLKQEKGSETETKGSGIPIVCDEVWMGPIPEFVNKITNEYGHAKHILLRDSNAPGGARELQRALKRLSIESTIG